MKTSQFFKYTTIALLIMNFAILAFLFFRKPPPHLRMHPLRAANEILKLNEADYKIFENLAKAHHKEVVDINNQQKELLKPYFNHLLDSSNNNREDLLNQIQQLERKKIEITYHHFETLKDRLKSIDDSDFKTFINRSLQSIFGDNKKNRPAAKGLIKG